MLEEMFSVVGEEIIRDIFQERNDIANDLFRLNDYKILDFFTQIEVIALEKRNGNTYTFDGKAKVDIGIKIEDKDGCIYIFPIEVKTGLGGLHFSEMNKKLSSCSLHKNIKNRINGNMFSVLDRGFEELFDIDSEMELRTIGLDDIKLCRDYGIIACNQVLGRWYRRSPYFRNYNVKMCSIECICDHYGKDTFNKLVKRKLLKEYLGIKGDYYSLWN